MIDLHCHILPGIDDGARDISDSLAMARQAAQDGIEQVCATPHIRHDHDVRIGELAARVARVNAEIAEAGIGVVVLTGGEVAETIVDDLDDDELAAVALGGGGGWVLLEPAPGPLSDGLRAVIERLRARGYRTVLAHPERHYTADLARRLTQVVELGGLVQATAEFLLRDETAGAAGDLAAAGVIHVLGSDAHSSRYGRRVELAAALARLSEVDVLAEHIDWIAREAPAAIVNGAAITAPFRPQTTDG